MREVAVLDVDGTLVDTNYHHALAWYRALREHGIVVPLRTLHRHVGMGGDKYVAAVAGEGTEERLGDALRSRHGDLVDELLGELEPLAGARELVVELDRRGLAVVLATSAKQGHAEAFLDLLDVREVVDAWTTQDDVAASKPAPDLVEAALAKAGSRDAVLVGDTVWDCEAASRAGIQTIAVLTGGAFSEQELLASGAAAVYASVEHLLQQLDDSPLAGVEHRPWARA